MLGTLAHQELIEGLRPRHPVVCIIDLIGLAVTLLLLSLLNQQPKLLIAVLPVAILLQYAVSCAYHWLPQNHWRQSADHGMITLLIAATFIPYWGRLLPASEMLWRLPILAALTLTIIALRCSRSRWRSISAVLYPVLGSFGLIVSFNELQVWLSPPALAMFWFGIGCYFLQFIIWKTERPDFWPQVFGYREVQHLVLLCGTTLHTIVVLSYLQ